MARVKTRMITNSVLTTHRLARLCCQCDASLVMKPAPICYDCNWQETSMAAVYIEIWQQCTQMRTGL